MINEAGTIFREFHAPEDYNVNHLLLPAAALLGRSFNNCIELRTKSKCEVIQYLFKVCCYPIESFIERRSYYSSCWVY